jgi:SAM-dependent methyltransferase
MTARATPGADAVLIAALREDLAAAGYTSTALAGVWGPAADAALLRGVRLPARRALADPAARAAGAVADLAALFALSDEVPSDRVAAALPRLGLSGVEALRLARVEGENVSPLVELRPCRFLDPDGVEEWWIAADLPEAVVGGPLPEDHVLGVGGASRTLAGLQLPRPADAVLDLGTGSGIQALRAARYSRRIVGTDVSERALAYARFNAELNGVEVELRAGSLFEPVRGERFDRILSNPPFVITPRRPGVPAYEYRDGGLTGDELVEAVVRGAADHLRPGGVAQLLGNWEDRPGADGRDRLADWASEAGLDVWVVEREVQDPVLYAETWIRDGGTRPGAPGYDDLLAAWLDDFASRGVRSVGFGYVTLRSPEGRRSFRRVERQQGGSTGLGAHLAACLDAQDWLAGTDDAALLEARLVVAGDVTEERHHWPGEEHPTAILLRQGGGFARSVPADAGAAGLVGACDGELSVGAIVTALASLLEADEPSLRAELLPVVRELVATGFLIPAA